MKLYIFNILIFLFTNQSFAQTTTEEWINNIITDMIELEGLEKYTSKKIPDDVIVNFMFVETTKNLEIRDDEFSFLIDHGNGKYCTKITFKYEATDKGFELLFSDDFISEMFGQEKKFINPWFDKKEVCN